MIFLFVTILFFMIIYCLFQKPGMFVSYIVIFPRLNRLVLDQIGLVEYRNYVGLLLLFLLLVHLPIKSIFIQFKNTIKNHIFIGSSLVFLGMFASLYIFRNQNSTISHELYKHFIFPVFFLFITSAIVFYNTKMFEEFFDGIIIFGLLYYAGMFLFVDQSQFYFDDRMSLYSSGQLDAISFARFSSLILITCTVSLKVTKKRLIQFLSIICLLPALYWLLFTATRGSILSVLFAIFCLFYLDIKKNKSKVFGYGILFFIIIFIVDVSISHLPAITRWQELYFYSEKGTSVSSRYFRWLYLLDIFRNNYLIGLGTAGFHNLTGNYPHNLFLELLVDYGFIGATAFVLIFIKGVNIWKKLIKIDNAKHINVIPILWVLTLVSSFFSGDIAGNVQFWIISGLMIAADNNYNH